VARAENPRRDSIATYLASWAKEGADRSGQLLTNLWEGKTTSEREVCGRPGGLSLPPIIAQDRIGVVGYGFPRLIPNVPYEYCSSGGPYKNFLCRGRLLLQLTQRAESEKALGVETRALAK